MIFQEWRALAQVCIVIYVPHTHTFFFTLLPVYKLVLTVYSCFLSTPFSFVLSVFLSFPLIFHCPSLFIWSHLLLFAPPIKNVSSPFLFLTFLFPPSILHCFLCICLFFSLYPSWLTALLFHDFFFSFLSWPHLIYPAHCLSAPPLTQISQLCAPGRPLVTWSSATLPNMALFKPRLSYVLSAFVSTPF